MKRKFTKDQIQKMFLSGLLMLALLYSYAQFLIGPLNRGERAAKAALTDLDAKIATSGTRLKRIKALEEQSRAAGETLAHVNTLIPEGEPIAWFPPRMRAFFERQGLKDIAIKLDRKEKTVEPELAATFNSFNWTVDLPTVGFTPLGIALAGLENEEQLLEIQRLQINTQPTNPEFQRVSLGIIALLH